MANHVDVLYIHPTKSLGSKQYSILPLGVIALLNLLIEQGYTVYGINIGIENSVDKEYSLEEDLKQMEYKLLLIDLHWYVTSYGAFQIAKLSKQLYPDRPVVIGGITATIFAADIIRKFNCIDYIMKGDGEISIVKLMNFLLKRTCDIDDIPNLCYRKEGRVIDKKLTRACNDMEQLDFIPGNYFKNFRYFYMNTIEGVQRGFKFYWINNGRGCLYNCSYCGGAGKNSPELFGRSKMIHRSVQSLIVDVERLHQQKVKIIGFTHDFEMFPDTYYKSLFSFIREKEIRVGLQMHCNRLPSKEFIEAVINTFVMGTTVFDILPLTGDERVRLENGKMFSNEELLEILAFMAGNNFRVNIVYGMNVPNEAEDSFMKTLNQIDYILHHYPENLLTISVDWFIPDPISPVKKDEKYRVTNTRNSFEDFYNYCTNPNQNETGYTDEHTKELPERVKVLNAYKDRVEQQGKKNIFFVGEGVF
ncbi:MAG TPA: radical SAM protein [Mobilitalea sp.]|nr:radical SAM protein [Mobilitalea sp.]